MSILLTYDVKKTSETVHTDLKRYLIEQYNWSSKIQADNGDWYDLPNTTLRKAGITRINAVTEFKTACNSVNAKWERFIAAEYNSANFDNQKL